MFLILLFVAFIINIIVLCASTTYRRWFIASVTRRKKIVLRTTPKYSYAYEVVSPFGDRTAENVEGTVYTLSKDGTASYTDAYHRNFTVQWKYVKDKYNVDASGKSVA